MKNATYKMTKTAKGKQGFLYEIFNAAGELISSRTSKRDYVAATACGGFFFGRLDLIGKGDHGRYLKDFAKNGRTEELERYSRIAYLQEQATATEPTPAQEQAPASATAKKEAPATDIVELERAEATKSKKQLRREAILQELEARYTGVTQGSLIRNFARLQNWLMKEWLRNGTEKVAGLKTNRAYFKKYDKDEYERIVLGMMRNVRNKESIFDHAARFPKNLGIDFLYNEITRYREKQATQARRAALGLAA